MSKHPKIIWQGGNKFLVRDGNGVLRKVDRDVEGIRRGDYLQPIGKDKDAYLKKYGSLPREDKKNIEKYLRRHK